MTVSALAATVPSSVSISCFMVKLLLPMRVTQLRIRTVCLG